MEIVNGYTCFTCGEASLAQRGIDPRQRGQADLGAPDPRTDAALALSAARAVTPAEPLGVNRPLASGPRGTLVNILA